MQGRSITCTNQKPEGDLCCKCPVPGCSILTGCTAPRKLTLSRAAEPFLQCSVNTAALRLAQEAAPMQQTVCEGTLLPSTVMPGCPHAWHKWS